MSENGDKGITQGECMFNVSKNSIFVEAIGSIDKFQASLGLARVNLEDVKEKENILQIEKDLYEIMGSLYLGKDWKAGKKRIEEIENEAGLMQERIKNLEGFLIPGENEIDARLNMSRTDCREAERRVVALKQEREEKGNLEFDENVLKYFNRLSYFLNLMWRSNLGVE